ncbi:hypothetical protein B0H14DRAFT_2916213 [Mycena olivaceomarginata]|nr:hypothetical protein B0H14DRAFT_2916213 [Mycena olivaceomarginata]
MPPAPTPRSLRSCNSPGCPNFNTVNRDSLLKCGKCKTATYCDKHWPVHKEFCKGWQATADATGEGVRDIKKKMGEFMWLVRGVPDYVGELFKFYLGFKREDPTSSGIIEFVFKTLAELDEAIRVLRSLPVVGEYPFHGMPGTPGHYGNPEGKPLTLRKQNGKQRRAFTEAVEKKMSFTECEPGTRPNLVNLQRMVGSSEDVLVICVTMRLAGTFSTHSYDFLFRDLDWRPAPAKPTSGRLAIGGPDDTSRVGGMVEFDMD